MTQGPRVVFTWHLCANTVHDCDEEKKKMMMIVTEHREERKQQGKKLEKERKQYSRGRKKEMLELILLILENFVAPENASKCKIRKKKKTKYKSRH